MSGPWVGVIDVGLGNVESVCNMLRVIGAVPRRVCTLDDFSADLPIILPGVGSFDAGVARLSDAGLFTTIRDLPHDHPILGICLGMQLLGSSSEEGEAEGLNRVAARCTRLPQVDDLPVPHMGWSRIVLASADPVISALPSNSRFYFTHSYRAECAPEVVLATATYGVDFVAAFRKGSTMGVQFHPEKSHRFGKALMHSWLERGC